MNKRKEIFTVGEGTADQEFTVGNSDGGQTVTENVVKVQTLGRCFNGKIDREMGNFVDMVKDKNQNAILTAIDCNITPKNEFAYGSINASSEQDASNVMANSDCWEHIRITAPPENVSERNNTLHVLNIIDETEFRPG